MRCSLQSRSERPAGLRPPAGLRSSALVSPRLVQRSPLSGAVRLGLALGLLSVSIRAASGEDSGLPPTLLPTNASPIGYCPPERLAQGPAAPEQYLNVYLPPGSPPPAGWPVVVTTGFGGGVATPPASSLNQVGPTAPLHDLVASGIGIVHFGATGVGGGQGLWYPAGHPSGRYESFRPQDDNPEKEAEWAIQWVKVQTQYPIDVESMGMRGSSGGAVLAVRTAMGPDRARATGSAQVRASTRIKALLVIQPPTSSWAMRQGPELEISLPDHLEQAANPGLAAEYLAQVDEELQKDYSIMRLAFETQEARENNAQQRICMVYGDPVLRVDGQVATMDLDPSGFPILHDAVMQPTQHDGWFGYVFFKRLLDLSPQSAAFHAEHSVFAMRDTTALAPPLDYHTRTYSGTFRGAEATQIGHDWLVSTLCATAPPQPQLVLPYGCGLNPSGSFSHDAGAPNLGATLTFSVDNPLGTNAVGSLPGVAMSFAPSPNFPCGVQLPGFGMTGGPGELLIGLGAPRVKGFVFGAPWQGPGSPSPIDVLLPADPVLAGLSLYVQGFLFDPTFASGNQYGLANAFSMTLLP